MCYLFINTNIYVAESEIFFAPSYIYTFERSFKCVLLISRRVDSFVGPPYNIWQAMCSPVPWACWILPQFQMFFSALEYFEITLTMLINIRQRDNVLPDL